MVGSSSEQEEACFSISVKVASTSHRCAIRVIATSVIQRIDFSADSHLVSTKNLANEGFKYLTLVRIAEEPSIPLLELNRQARNLIRT